MSILLPAPFAPMCSSCCLASCSCTPVPISPVLLFFCARALKINDLVEIACISICLPAVWGLPYVCGPLLATCHKPSPHTCGHAWQQSLQCPDPSTTIRWSLLVEIMSVCGLKSPNPCFVNITVCPTCVQADLAVELLCAGLARCVSDSCIWGPDKLSVSPDLDVFECLRTPS